MFDFALEELITAFDQGLMLLVVGGRSTNLSAEMRDGQNIVWLGSTDAASMGANSIPERVGVVLFLRFIDHKLFERLRADADRKKISFLGPFGTGELRKLYSQARKALESESSECEDAHDYEATQRKDYSGLVAAIFDRVKTEDLSEERLEDTSFLKALAEELSISWPSLSLKRTRRVFRSCLITLEVINPVQTSEEQVEEAEAQTRSESEEVAKLKREVARLQQKLSDATALANKRHGENSKLIGQNKSLRRRMQALRTELAKAEDAQAIAIEMMDRFPVLRLLLSDQGNEAVPPAEASSRPY
ncbi:MAG: hypothetical protein R3B52_00665 [Candidatus Paceibacterota bacterium]